MEIRKENLTIDDYTGMLNIDPTNYGLYIERGMLHARNHDFKKALDDYTMAIQLNPNSFEALGNRGNIYRQEKVYDLALTDYTRCLEINTMSFEGYINRGSLYDDMQEYRSAIEDFTSAIAINPSDYEVYLFRWKAYRALGEEETATKDLEKAFAVNQFATNNWLERRMICPLSLNGADAHFQDGLELQGSHDYDAAIVEFTKAIAIGSKSDHIAYSNRGMAHAAKFEYGLAIEDYKRSLEINSEYTKAYSNLGIAYFETKNYVIAIENLTQAIDRISKNYNATPDDRFTLQNSLYYRGVSYRMIREFYSAKKDFERILSIDPNDIETKKLLIDVSAWI